MERADLNDILFCNTFGNTSTDGIYRIDLGRNDSRETLAAPLKIWNGRVLRQTEYCMR